MRAILLFLAMMSITGVAAHASDVQITEILTNDTISRDLVESVDQNIFADFFENWVNKGIALTEDGKYSAALKAFDNAFMYYSDNTSLIAKGWFGRARVYDALERYDEALFASDEVIQISPDDSKLMASAWVKKGVALRNLGRYSESFEAFQTAAELVPDDARTLQQIVFTSRLMNAGS